MYSFQAPECLLVLLNSEYSHFSSFGLKFANSNVSKYPRKVFEIFAH